MLKRKEKQHTNFPPFCVSLGQDKGKREREATISSKARKTSKNHFFSSPLMSLGQHTYTQNKTSKTLQEESRARIKEG